MKPKKLCNRPIKMCTIDETLFVRNLPQDMTTEDENVDDFTNNVTHAV